ncbi:MAG TPA: DUF4381 family protein [Chthoniobacterales bacterium]
MNPQAAPTPAPLHDIAGPIAFFPYPIWVVAAAGVSALALLALLGWFFFFRARRPGPVPTPAERAMAELARLRGGVATTEPYAFSIAVSNVLRSYLSEARGLRATTQTSREFLESISRGQVFRDEEREALAAFLEKADLIKFARMDASADDCAGLLESAERLVKSGTEQTTEAAAK